MINHAKTKDILVIFSAFDQKREKTRKYHAFICVEKTGSKLYRLHKKYGQFWRKEEISKNGKCKIKLPGDLVGRKNIVKIIIVNKNTLVLHEKATKIVNTIYQSEQNEKNIAKMTIFEKSRRFFCL